MSHEVESMIIIATWVALLVFLLAGRNLVKRYFLEGSTNVRVSDASGQANKPGSSLSQIGALFVFAANIATFAVIFAAATSPAVIQRLDWVSVDLPPWVNVLGSMLFVLNAVWGLLA